MLCGAGRPFCYVPHMTYSTSPSPAYKPRESWPDDHAYPSSLRILARVGFDGRPSHQLRSTPDALTLIASFDQQDHALFGLHAWNAMIGNERFMTGSAPSSEGMPRVELAMLRGFGDAVRAEMVSCENPSVRIAYFMYPRHDAPAMVEAWNSMLDALAA